MSEVRKNYKKTDIKLELIKELRSRSMTWDDMHRFISGLYRRFGKVPAKFQNPDAYMVCKRTVNRTIDSIRQLYGRQLEYNKEYDTYKLELYDFPDTVDADEIQALDVALQKMNNNVNTRRLLESLKSKLTSRLYRKIENSDPKKAMRKINDLDQRINSNYAFIGPRLIVNFDEDIKSALDSAISRQYMVRFKYYKKDVVVCPLGIMYGANNVYLIAYENKGGQIEKLPRHYILSNISGLTQTRDWFARDDNFSIEEYANSMFGIYNDGQVYDIEWKIKSPNIIKIARNYRFHPTQEFQDNADGTLTITMRTGGLRAISIFLAQWGGKIVPIKPQELVDDYRQLLNDCLASMTE